MINDDPHYKLAISVLVQFRGLAHVYLELICEATAETFAPKEVDIAVLNNVTTSASVIRVAA